MSCFGLLCTGIPTAGEHCHKKSVDVNKYYNHGNFCVKSLESKLKGQYNIEQKFTIDYMSMLSRLLSGPQELFSNMENQCPTTLLLPVQESIPLRLVQALEVAT